MAQNKAPLLSTQYTHNIMQVRCTAPIAHETTPSETDLHTYIQMRPENATELDASHNQWIIQVKIYQAHIDQCMGNGKAKHWSTEGSLVTSTCRIHVCTQTPHLRYFYVQVLSVLNGVVDVEQYICHGVLLGDVQWQELYQTVVTYLKNVMHHRQLPYPGFVGSVHVNNIATCI